MNTTYQHSTTISGVLQDIRFHKQNFLIGKLDTGISVKGNIISPQVGMEYHFTGKWEHHPRWGATFFFNEYRASYPRELSAIRAYLMENCKWIGPEISKKLVNTFGETTLEVCKAKPEKVAKRIRGLTRKRALEISAMLKNNEANEELQLQLKGILAGTKVSRRAVSMIIELYGQQAPEKIKENPYQLIDDIEGIGFLTADEMALKVGYDKEGSPRIRAGVVHVLKESAFSHGHTCLPLDLLVDESDKLLQVDKEKIHYVIERLIENKCLIRNNNFIFLLEFYDAEKMIAQKIRNLLYENAKSKKNM